MKWFNSFLVLLLGPSDGPRDYKAVVQTFRDRYAVLNGAPIYKNVSPTIKFSFQPPPQHNEDLSSFTLTSEYLFQDVAGTFGPEKPIAVYLPGLDCAGISASKQFDDLAETFELWRMTVNTEDRSSFFELTTKIVEFISDLSNNAGRDVIIIGESFGGMLAPIVAATLEAKAIRSGKTSGPVSGLVLVNPATSFDDTNWDALGPALASLRLLEATGDTGATPYTVPGGLLLSALIPDSRQYQQILDILMSGSSPSLDKVPELLQAIDEGFGILGQRLPGELIKHRVSNWMSVGAQFVKDIHLSKLKMPTLVVAGEDDKFLPSKQEAERLASVMPNCKKLTVKGAGHYVLDDRVNLTEAIIYSELDPLRLRESAKRYDPVLDWRLPSHDELVRTDKTRVEPLRKLTSPVFFSTDSDGKRWKGIGQVPSEGPLVFVANHQLIGLDLGLLISELLFQRGVVVRGLAHPIIFQGNASVDNMPGRPHTPGLRGEESSSPFDNKLFQQFGALMVTPRNYYRLLQSGQNALLFPGGVREVFHGRDEAYKLLWPEKVDFVRTAARFNATIVPVSCLGSADSFHIVAETKEMARLPFVGERIRQASMNITAARFDQDNADELFFAPFVVPKLPPARHYFVMGKPMSTSDLDLRDKDACQEFYEGVKKEIERGFEDVLRAREHDPYLDSVKRLVYEQATGKGAPTFSELELNAKEN